MWNPVDRMHAYFMMPVVTASGSRRVHVSWVPSGGEVEDAAGVQ